MANRKRVFQDKRLFTPNVVRRYSQSTGLLKAQTMRDMSGSTSGEVTSSFRFDPVGSPIKSTQQLPVDWSDFTTHTFFSSAESNVNVAFEKIINNFPFDGTRQEYDEYLDSLTGYENYILNERYPRYTGYLTLTSSYITVQDRAGTLFPSISRLKTGTTILDPRGKSFTIEAFIGIPKAANGKQTLFYHSSDVSACGYSVYIDNDAGTTSANLHFTVFSGSRGVTATHSLSKGQFAPFNFVFNADNKSGDGGFARIISGSTVVAKSAQRFRFKRLTTNGGPLIIGSGSSVVTLKPATVNFTPTQTFSGSIKRVNFYDKARNLSDIKDSLHKTAFSQPRLLLSFRMNEATGSYLNNSVVLDHSGNSLHSQITNYSDGVRTQRPFLDPIKFENAVVNPTLFPSHPAVGNLNTQLLLTASSYDVNNPNLITKLIPEHYLSVAAQNGSVSNNPEGDLRDGIRDASAPYSVPGAAKFGQPQIISGLLFVWAREFDKVKMMLDQISELVFVDYEEEGSIADTFLPHLSNYYGFELPNMFPNATADQIFKGENVSGDSLTKNGLSKVQSLINRRILTEVREIISSKGTTHAIKTMFRSSGIDPDRMFRFVEFGGVNDLRLGASRQKITEISTMLDFSGSVVMGTGSIDAQGRRSSMPTFKSTFLSASRVEVGRPLIAGTMVSKNSRPPHGFSNNMDDGLLTSGSWSYEGRYRFPVILQSKRPQSLIRIHCTSSDFPRYGSSEPLLLNLVASKENLATNSANITLHARPGFGSSDGTLSLVLTGSNIFNGDRWYVSCGRKDSRDCGTHISSSYFITVARQEFGEIKEYYHTSSFFAESSNAGLNAFQKKFDTAASPGAPTKASANDSLSLGSPGGSNGTSDGDEFTINVPTAVGGSGTAITVRMAPNLSSSPAAGQVFVVRATSDNTSRNRLVAAFNGTNDPNFDATKIEYGAGVTGGTSGIQGVDATGGSNAALVSLSAAQARVEGNSIAVANSVGTIYQSVAFTGGVTPSGTKKTFRLVNASGSFLCIGSQSIGSTGSLNFLNNKTAVTDDFARYTYFDGRVGHMRFWSKHLTENEKREHIRNFGSLGVEDPKKNFGFTHDVTGSFEKLRLDVSTDQPVTTSNGNGFLVLTDFSQNFTGSLSGGTLQGFDHIKSVTKPERFDFSIISPRYDQPSSPEKVRLYGLTQGANLANLGGLPGPTYEIPRQRPPIDDARFAIEFSVMQALDEDIMKIFSTLESLDTAIGGPEMMFAEEYPGLRDLREVYFNRLTGAVNYKQFFELFRWLDNAFNDVIEDLIPRKTNYLGFNFIIEPHALERAKIVYGSGDVYLGESLRRNLKGQLLLRQLVAEVKKF